MSTTDSRRVTIADLARQLGLSKASVSYALNGRKGVSDQTRQRVRDLADELGFQASSAAVALSASRAGTIGIVIARDPAVIVAEAFYMRTLLGVEDYLNQADAALLLRVTGEHGQDLDVYRRWALQRRVDGFILFDEVADDPRVPLLNALGVPGVLVASSDRDDTIGRLVTPEAETISALLDYLHGLGHSTIGYIGGPRRYVHEQVRSELVASSTRCRGMALEYLEGNYEYEGAAALARQLLAGTPRPTALILGNDIMAIAAARTALDCGFDVPGDVSVVAWDDSTLCTTARPQLTALDNGLSDRARMAADVLFTMIASGARISRSSPAGTLLVRQTTGPAPR